jgi:hypothetical protein
MSDSRITHLGSTTSPRGGVEAFGFWNDITVAAVRGGVRVLALDDMALDTWVSAEPMPVTLHDTPAARKTAANAAEPSPGLVPQEQAEAASSTPDGVALENTEAAAMLRFAVGLAPQEATLVRSELSDGAIPTNAGVAGSAGPNANEVSAHVTGSADSPLQAAAESSPSEVPNAQTPPLQT